MQLVIDANILLAALLRDSTTRDLIFDPRVLLVAPEHLITETKRHLQSSDRFRKRLRLTTDELAIVFSLLFSNIRTVNRKLFQAQMQQAEEIAPHSEDAPYLALALHLSIPIWSHDEGMRDQTFVRIISTKELLTIL